MSATEQPTDAPARDRTLATCKFCQGDIRWGRNIHNGRGIPLNPDPTPDGAFAVTTADDIVAAGAAIRPGEIAVEKLRPHDHVDPDTTRYEIHFTTCTGSNGRR